MHMCPLCIYDINKVYVNCALTRSGKLLEAKLAFAKSKLPVAKVMSLVILLVITEMPVESLLRSRPCIAKWHNCGSHSAVADNDALSRAAIRFLILN